MLPDLAADTRQQLSPQLLIPQTPTPPARRPLAAILFLAPSLLHPPLQFLTRCRRLPFQSLLAQQSVHTRA